MPGGATPGGVPRAARRAANAAVLESAWRLALPTPPPHNALWTPFADDLIAAGRAECSSAARIVAKSAIRPKEQAQTSGRFPRALNVVRFPSMACS